MSHRARQILRDSHEIVPQCRRLCFRLADYPATLDRSSIYDIDGFVTPNGTMQSLRQRGTTVFCYFSFGTAEDYRPDYGRFPQSVLGGLVCNQQASDFFSAIHWTYSRQVTGLVSGPDLWHCVVRTIVIDVRTRGNFLAGRLYGSAVCTESHLCTMNPPNHSS